MANKKTKPVAKKATTRKPAPKAKATTRRTATQKTKTQLSTLNSKLSTSRRPDSNQPPTPEHINGITNAVLGLIAQIDDYTANLRALDRQRHNGVGMKRLGFIEAAFRLSTKFPQYFPHWLSTAKFQNDLNLFNAIRSLVEVCRSLEEKAWNINVESSDMIYTNALEYYSQVQDAPRVAVNKTSKQMANMPSAKAKIFNTAELTPPKAFSPNCTASSAAAPSKATNRQRNKPNATSTPL